MAPIRETECGRGRLYRRAGCTSSKEKREVGNGNSSACNAERSGTQPQVSDSADLAINKTDYTQSTNTYISVYASGLFHWLSMPFRALPSASSVYDKYRNPLPTTGSSYGQYTTSALLPWSRLLLNCRPFRDPPRETFSNSYYKWARFCIREGRRYTNRSTDGVQMRCQGD